MERCPPYPLSRPVAGGRAGFRMLRAVELGLPLICSLATALRKIDPALHLFNKIVMALLE